jgi:hypothetical protein
MDMKANFKNMESPDEYNQLIENMLNSSTKQIAAIDGK